MNDNEIARMSHQIVTDVRAHLGHRGTDEERIGAAGTVKAWLYKLLELEADTQGRPAEDERVKELIRDLGIAVNSCRDVTTLGRFAASVDPVGWVRELQAHLESVTKNARTLLPVQPAQQEDDGWVTFGRIKTDIESETETFERIPVQPAASTPTVVNMLQHRIRELRAVRIESGSDRDMFFLEGGIAALENLLEDLEPGTKAQDEKIASAAIRKDGIVYPCWSHTFFEIKKMNLHAPDDVMKLAEQGFVTSTGRFVDRREGLQIAETAGQIVHKHSPRDELMSEDLR